jgi:hypothetical protein
LCMRLPAQRRHAAGPAWRVSAGCRNTMASEAKRKLWNAVREDKPAEIERLIAEGADANAFEGADDWTPLLLAAMNDHVAAITALVAAGALVDGKDSNGSTPLVFAAATGHTAAIDALLAAGADLNQADGAALHTACSWGCLDAARVLVEAGARTHMSNPRGQRPIDVVRALTRLLVAVTRTHHAIAPPRWSAQVCDCAFANKSAAPALCALLAAAPPWSRRRPVAVACFGDAWECEA